MSLQVPDTTYQAILANPRNSQKLRLAALRSLARAPIAFLLRIECDPLTPDKIRFALVQRREAEMSIRRRLRAARDTKSAITTDR